MKENGIPKKTRFLWQVRISLIGFIPVAVLLFLLGNALVPFARSNFGGGAAYICAVVYSRLFCKL